jgi:hypothetical protein
MATAKIERIIGILKSSAELSNDGSGACASFSVVGGVGVKSYRTDAARDCHYREQKRLAALGLAPFVDGCVNYTDCDGTPKYAYLSGLADSVASDVYNGFWPHSLRGAESDRVKCESDREALRAELSDRAGYNWSDDHNGNWGYVNGRPVLIDCSGY